MFKRKANRLLRVMLIAVTYTRSIASGSIISSLTNLYTKAKEMDTLKQTFGPDSLGGVYQGYLHIAQDNKIVGGSEAIETLYQRYSSREACNSNQRFSTTPQPLQKSDIINILLQTNQDLGWLKNAAESNISQEDINNAKKSYKQSCQKLLTCMGKSEENYDLCTDTIHNEYHTLNEQNIKKQEMISDFYGIQFFNNGTLDDSTYDLMLDIQLIGDIMYSENKKTNQTLYYRMPTAAGGGANPVTPPTPSSPGSNNTTTTSPTNSIQKPLTPTSLITIGRPPFSGDVTNTLDQELPLPNTSYTEHTITEGNKTIPTTSQTQSTTGLPLFSNNICIDETPPDTTAEEITNQNPFIDEHLTPNDINQIRSDYQEHLNDQYTSYTPTEQPSEQPSNPRIIPGENNNIGDALADMNMLDDIRACVQLCDDQYSGNDALVCKASCMCGTIPEKSDQSYNRYLDFKIKFCRIPTQTEAPYNNTTTVYSIEEITDAINSTLTALRQSGALNKRNETQEYLDTSLRNLDLGKSFIFSFNIATKTSPNTKNPKTIQQETDTVFAKAIKGSPIYHPSPDLYSASQRTRTSSKPVKKTTEKTQQSLAIMKHIVDRQTILNTTLTDLDIFRKQFGLQMKEVNNITANMKTKAENAQ